MLPIIHQETIALYEERLSSADTKRYELEDEIVSLQDLVRAAKERPLSPGSAGRQATTALEIDNATLREENQHLVLKASTLEDQLMDARIALEHAESVASEKTMRTKEREDSVRAELVISQKEVERITKSEESAKARIEEMEEALRENKVALENARAEIENCRTEIAVCVPISIFHDIFIDFRFFFLVGS